MCFTAVLTAAGTTASVSVPQRAPDASVRTAVTFSSAVTFSWAGLCVRAGGPIISDHFERVSPGSGLSSVSSWGPPGGGEEPGGTQPSRMVLKARVYKTRGFPHTGSCRLRLATICDPPMGAVAVSYRNPVSHSHLRIGTDGGGFLCLGCCFSPLRRSMREKGNHIFKELTTYRPLRLFCRFFQHACEVDVSFYIFR